MKIVCKGSELMRILNLFIYAKKESPLQIFSEPIAIADVTITPVSPCFVLQACSKLYKYLHPILIQHRLTALMQSSYADLTPLQRFTPRIKSEPLMFFQIILMP